MPEDKPEVPNQKWMQYAAPAVALALFWHQSQKKEGPRLFSPEWIRTMALIGGVALSVIGGYFATQERINTNAGNIERNALALEDLRQRAGKWQDDFIGSFNKYQEKQAGSFDKLNETLTSLEKSQVHLTTMVEERFKQRQETEHPTPRPGGGIQ